MPTETAAAEGVRILPAAAFLGTACPPHVLAGRGREMERRGSVGADLRRCLPMDSGQYLQQQRIRAKL